MSSLLNAFAQAGLANQSEIDRQNSEEAQALREKQLALKPKTLAELASRKSYDFFSRVEWLVDYIESNPTQERKLEVENFVRKNMLSGPAGKAFLDQIRELQVGMVGSISDLKAKWPKIWKKS